MYAALRYHATHHPYSHIPTQPDANPHSSDNKQDAAADATADATAHPVTVNGGPTTDTGEAQQAQQQEQQQQRTGAEDDHVPDSPTTFSAALRELARDIVIKHQQCEYIVDRLPGIGISEREQEQRLRDLDRELREVNVEAGEALREKDALLQKLDEVIVGVRRV